MLVLIYLILIGLAFSPLAAWVLVAAMLLPPLAVSIVTRDPTILVVSVVALMGAAGLYASLAWLVSIVTRNSFGDILRGFRVVYFVAAAVFFVVLTFSLDQFAGFLH
jgi:hypothetical protein